jgi:hypothetical protein
VKFVVHCSSPHACCMFRPCHSRFNHLNNIWWKVKIIMPLDAYLPRLRPDISSAFCSRFKSLFSH